MSLSILGKAAGGLGSLLGETVGGFAAGVADPIADAVEAAGFTTNRQRGQMQQILWQQKLMEMQKAADAEKMAQLQKGQQGIFLQDIQSQRSPMRNQDPLTVWAKAQQSGFDPQMSMNIAGMVKPQSQAPMSPIAKLMQDRVNIANADPNDPRLPQLDAAIQQQTNPKASGGNIGQFNPRDYTTDSFAKFMETQNPSDLQRFDPPSDMPTFIGQAALESATTADQAFMSSREYDQLANELLANAETLPSGSKGSAVEFLKKVTGNEDYDTLLRKNYQSLRVSSAINSLPPGVASDKDIQLVMSKTLDTYANPETVAQYMRGLAKASRIEGEYHQFRADYLYKNGNAQGMNQAWKAYAEKNANSWGLAPQNTDDITDLLDKYGD